MTPFTRKLYVGGLSALSLSATGQVWSYFHIYFRPILRLCGLAAIYSTRRVHGILECITLGGTF